MSAAASASGDATALLSEAPSDLDPYLAWVIKTDGQDHACAAGPKDRLPGDANGRVILVAELKSGDGQGGGLRNWLASAPIAGAMPAIYESFEAGGFVTLAVPKSALQPSVLTELQRQVKRFCLATDVLPQRPLVRVPRGAWNNGLTEPPGATTPVVVGVIDTGFAFAHAAFRTVGGRLRIAALWDQDPCPAFASIDGRTPPEFGYGREVAREGLQACIDQFTTHGSVDEAACYEAADLPELRHRFTHGTATAGMIAERVGTKERLVRDPDKFASTASTRLSADAGAPDLVLVQVPRTGVQDSTGQGLAAHVIDGIHYIVARAGPGSRRVVVNLSFAIHTGPHDGTDLLEAAIDAAVQHYRDTYDIELKVVLPTGNSRLDRGHAVFKNDPSTALPLAVPPGCETSNFVEVWLPKGATNSVTLIAPGGQTSIHWSPGSSAAFMPGGALAMAAVIPASSNVRGGQGRQLVLVAIGPTKVLAPGPGARTAAPAGTWHIEVGGIPGKTGTVHAWIAYSQRSAGAAPRARQARFVDPRWDPARFLRPALLDADPHGLVRRAGTISGIATGSKRTVVHGDFHRGGYSPSPTGSKSGPPTRDAFYDSQPLSGSRGNTPMSAPCEESWAQVGVPAPGTRSGSVVRVRGTSFSVPQVARELTFDVTVSLVSGSPGV